MKKYEQDKLITSFNDLVEQELIYVKRVKAGGKVYHKGWFMGWQLKMVEHLIKTKSIYTVVRRELK